MSGEVRHEDSKPFGERGRDEAPVDGRSAKAVDEQDRLAGACDEVTNSRAPDRRETLVEPDERRCVRHMARVSFGSNDEPGRTPQLSPASDMRRPREPARANAPAGFFMPSLTARASVTALTTLTAITRGRTEWPTT